VRAPWRWQWRRIAGLLALWSGVTAVCWWAPVLWIAVAVWFVLWVRAAYTQPLPSPTGGPLSEDEEAGHRVEVRASGAHITVTPRSVRVEKVDPSG
jgi:hypothetical protein